MKIRKMTILLAVGALFLALNSGESAQMQKDMKPVMPSGMRTAPTLTRVERTADGYALVGSGFGTDRNQVQVFEGSTQVPAAAVRSVANDRVTVKSQASGTVQHRVVVAGRASGVVSYNHPTAQAAGATGVGVAKSIGVQEQVKAGTLGSKAGFVKDLKDPGKDLGKGREFMGLGETKMPGGSGKATEEFARARGAGPAKSDDPCAPKGQQDVKVSGLTGTGVVGLTGGQKKSKDGGTKPAKEAGERGGAKTSGGGGGAWSGTERMVDRTDSSGGQSISLHEDYNDSEGNMKIDTRSNPDGSGEQVITAENKDGTRTRAVTQWDKNGKVTYSEVTRTKAEQDKADKAEKDKAEKDKADKAEKDKTETKTGKTSCRSDDDRCVNQFFSDRNDPTTKMYAERRRKEIAEQMARRKQRAVGQQVTDVPSKGATEADLRRAAAGKRATLTQPGGRSDTTTTAGDSPCPEGRPEAQKIREMEKKIKGGGEDPGWGKGGRR